MGEIKFKPIGYVRSRFKDPEDLTFACEKGLLTKTKSEIVINKEYAEGMAGLSSFSHIWIIYHINEANRTEMKTYPGPTTIKGLPVVGVFASRSQYRPNKIGLRLVKLAELKGNVLKVIGLDAIDKTPVLDVKPFIPHFDKPKKAKVAEWYRGWYV